MLKFIKGFREKKKNELVTVVTSSVHIYIKWRKKNMVCLTKGFRMIIKQGSGFMNLVM